jgi:long-chain fatty acid transport protein
MVKKTLVGFVAAGLVITATGQLDASNGYFATGYGTASKGEAGAGVAIATDTLAPALNPATLVFVTDQIDLGVELFNPNRSYEVTGVPSGYPGTFGLAPGKVDSGSTLFAVPAFGAAWKAGANGAFGIALYGNGGMNTNYNAPTFGVAPAGVDLSQMFITPTYAMRLGERHAIGFSGVLAYQRFEAKGLQAFAPFSSDADSLTDNAHANSLGGGVHVGYVGNLSRYLSVGASYQSRIWMQKFDPYKGLFAQAGSFDIPSSWVAGVALKPTENIDVLADVQQVRYSEVKSIANALLPNLVQAPLGAEEGAGFGWQNMTIYKFGVQHRVAGGWTWRAGYSYGKQPIPSSEVLFNILAPGVEEQHATFGLTKAVGTGHELSLAVTRAFSKTVTGANPLEAPGSQQIGLEMNQWDVQIGYAHRFGRK